MPTRRPAAAMAATIAMPAQVSTRVMSPKSAYGTAYQASSPGGYTNGEPTGIVLCSTCVYGLPPANTTSSDSAVARRTSLPSASGSRCSRSDAATSTASPAPAAATGMSRSAAHPRPRPVSSRRTRSTCGALTSIPSTHQKTPRTTAARTAALLLLARGGTESGEIILEQRDQAPVLGEIAVPERGLRLLEVLVRGPHELGDLSGRRRGRAGRRRRTGRRLGGRRGALTEELVERALERRGHHDATLRREDHALQLRDAALRRLDEEPLDVQERVAHRKHEQVAPEARRPAALRTEQRELLLDRRVAVDDPFDLQRSEDLPVLREAEHA